MKPVALVMAGGRGRRMQATGAVVAKPLVAVRGVSLLERNLWALARAGLHDLAISVAAEAPEVAERARAAGERLAQALGGSLRMIVEERPLGNAGCAGRLREAADEVVLVFADNLTDLPLADLLARHREAGATLTLAAHRETFTMPFGELAVADGRVTAYIEKPRREYLVSSAACVLGRPALELLPGDRSFGLADLAGRLLERGEPVAAFAHASRWIDVNDAAAVARAEEMVRAAPESFEQWAPRADRTRVALAIEGPEGLLLEPAGAAQRLTLPEQPVSASGEAASLAVLTARLGLEAAPVSSPVVMDELGDEAALVRHRVHALRAPQGWRPPGGVLWWRAEAPAGERAIDPLVWRARGLAPKAAATPAAH